MKTYSEFKKTRIGFGYDLVTFQTLVELPMHQLLAYESGEEEMPPEVIERIHWGLGLRKFRKNIRGPRTIVTDSTSKVVEALEGKRNIDAPKGTRIWHAHLTALPEVGSYFLATPAQNRRFEQQKILIEILRLAGTGLSIDHIRNHGFRLGRDLVQTVCESMADKGLLVRTPPGRFDKFPGYALRDPNLGLVREMTLDSAPPLDADEVTDLRNKWVEDLATMESTCGRYAQGYADAMTQVLADLQTTFDAKPL